MNRWARGLRALQTSILEADGLDLACRLTLILPAASDWVVGEAWVYKAPLRILAVAGLVVPTLHRSRPLWAALAAIMVLKTFDNYWLQDNHIFLLTYWMVALALALHLAAPQPPLRTCARLLIGWSFLFASLWKIAWSPDFTSGSYFQYTFMTDRRFFDVATILGHVEPETLQRALASVDALFTTSASVAELRAPAALVVLAACTTWWTIIIESAIAVAFLWPEGHGLSRMRDPLLLTFALTTYLIAPVWTFGWTLLTLGVSQIGAEHARLRMAYLAALLLVLAYDLIPLGSIATSIFAG